MMIPPLTYRTQILVAAFCFAFLSFASLQNSPLLVAQQVPFHQQSVIEFANKKTGVRALTQADIFVNSMSRFDLTSRLRKEGELTKEDYFEFIQTHVMDWNEEDTEKLTAAIQSAKEKMAAYKIPFPKKILLIKTDGKDEGGAAYCRGPAIILPRNMVETMKVRPLEGLLTHELFHVLSNQNPDLRQKLYSIIGFQPCGEIKLPGSIADRKITNPDGPTIDYYVDLKIKDETVSVVPILFARTDYDLKKGGSFFGYMNFQLLAVEKAAAGWQPKLKDKEPIFFVPGETESYFDNIGRNTGYIIHPDEVLADNFVYLVQQRKKLKTPQIVADMKKLLAK